MASVASISPADNAVRVAADQAVDVNITNATDMTLSLVEIIVNGVSCTVANGGLDYWQTTQVSGGSIIADLTDVWFATVARWFDSPLDEVTVTVKYDSTTISTTTFTSVHSEGWQSGADIGFESMAAHRASSARLDFDVMQQPLGGDYKVEFLVSEAMRITADLRYYVAERYLSRHLGAGLVGGLQLQRHHASGSAQGWKLDRHHATGIGQAWQIDRCHAAGMLGVVFIYRNMASALLGLEYLERVSASGVVRGVNRGTHFEANIMEQETFDELNADGVHFTEQT
ncbi:MAG: hypothetical protein GY906_11660 [bacterium]|nr:hypothetical protein [bacterium]